MTGARQGATGTSDKTLQDQGAAVTVQHSAVYNIRPARRPENMLPPWRRLIEQGKMIIAQCTPGGSFALQEGTDVKPRPLVVHAYIVLATL